jgi:hypothetical protein
VHKWWNRYLDEGVDGLQDRSSQPHGSPRRLSRDTVRRVVAARLLPRLADTDRINACEHA